MFANCTAYFSLDHNRFMKYRELKKDTFVYQLSSMLHNFAVMFCIIQLCILYFFSGMYQPEGGAVAQRYGHLLYLASQGIQQAPDALFG